ncbi:dnaK protein [Tritrichomonas foetus]|uniref:DnaK protein n=1 Tax=Tritrichomonas foetus TaxID=1144522 RepID=A0A1J4JXD3_9EUKA|nr:dnaK protein [Tritrichomonas foetus]|eukprot:OHT02196.1 dnaK protein [Tritrichomonas foetus]
MMKGISPILGNTNGLTRREIMALVLRHLITTVDEGRWSPETAQIVLTVEPLLPRADRYAISEAVKLSNATLAAIIDSPTAAAQVYALEKRSLYIEQAKHVLFIDYGATYTWAAVFRFENIDDTPIVQELSIVTNSSLGGNLMDRELADLLLTKFAENNKIPKPTERRIISRFIEEARRAKEILTVNKDADIRLEDVVDDYGLNYHLTREVFQELISNCNQSLRNLFNDAIEKAGINATELDSIELIGGITRVPYVQECLMEISGMEKLNRTMNSDEAVALGAGYRGASNSGAFIVKKVFLAPFVNTNISIVHNGKIIELFNESSRLNETVYYAFNASENSEITIAAERELSTFSIALPENTTDDVVINISFGFDDLTLPTVTSITINETAYNKNNVCLFTLPEWTLSPEQFQNSTDFIHRMDVILDERRRFAKIKNDYEGYIYRVKNNLEYNNTFKKVVNETERENLTNIANEHETWLFDTHPEPMNESMIRAKYDELRDQVSPAESRAEEYIKRAPAFQKLNFSLNHVFRHLNETWPETKPWLTEEQVNSVWSQYNRTHEWFVEKYAAQLNQSDFEDPVVRVSEIDTQRMLLEWNFNSTNKIKKPTPTPVPKPETNQQFININGQNVSIVNGSINGVYVNGTFIPGNETTIFNGTDIHFETSPETNETSTETNETSTETNETSTETNETSTETNETTTDATPEGEKVNEEQQQTEGSAENAGEQPPDEGNSESEQEQPNENENKEL